MVAGRQETPGRGLAGRVSESKDPKGRPSAEMALRRQFLASQWRRLLL